MLAGPVEPHERVWSSGVGARSICDRIARWGADESDRSGKAALGCVHHDACTALRAKGEARGIVGLMLGDTPAPLFPMLPADVSFVGCARFTNRAARLMRLSVFAMGLTGIVGEHAWHSDSMSLRCAWGMCDAAHRPLVQWRRRPPLARWITRTYAAPNGEPVRTGMPHKRAMRHTMNGPGPAMGVVVQHMWRIDTDFGATPAKVWPMSASFGQHRPILGRARPDLADSDQCGADVVQVPRL